MSIEQGKAAAGTPINSRPDLQEILEQTAMYVSGDADDLQGSLYPRFGALSMLARSTPMYVYDHEALAEVCKTAFTDGVHVFFYGPFLEKLVESEVNSKTLIVERTPVLLHELFHKASDHVSRLHSFPKEIRNTAADGSINPPIYKMLTAAPFNMTPGPVFMKGIGLDDQETIDRWAEMTEEAIAREILNKPPGPKPGSTPSPNGPSAAAGGGGRRKKSTQDSDGSAAGGKQRSHQKPRQDGHEHGEYGCSSDSHMISPRELAKIFEDNPDISYVKDALEYPDSDDAKGQEAMLQTAQSEVVRAVQQATELTRHMGDRYPGQHIDHFLRETISGLRQPKIQWRAGIADISYGNGIRTDHTDDVPGTMAFVEPIDMGLDSPTYIGTYIPSKIENALILITDSSGSVHTSMLRELLSEAVGTLKSHEGASQVLLFSADTALRGDPIHITEEDVDQVAEELAVYGRGGTDFIDPIREIWTHPEVEAIKERVTAVIYFTDLGAAPTQKNDLPEGFPLLAYVTPPECLDLNFKSSVSDHAIVLEIDDVEVDLAEEAEKVEEHTTRRQRAPRP